MKKLLIITLILLACNVEAQVKAIGDICFGMTKKEIKKVASTDSTYISLGKLYAIVNSNEYFGVPEYEDDKFKAIKLSHVEASIYAIGYDFDKYNESDCKNDILSLFNYFTHKFGEPKINKGFQLKSEVQYIRRLLVAEWHSSGMVTRIWETYLNGIIFPEISLIEESYLNSYSE